jgi:hypothetical protein
MNSAQRQTVTSVSAAGGVSGAIVIILTWALSSLGHIPVPTEVSASLVMVAAPLLHLMAGWLAGAEPPATGA